MADATVVAVPHVEYQVVQAAVAATTAHPPASTTLTKDTTATALVGVMAPAARHTGGEIHARIRMTTAGGTLSITAAVYAWCRVTGDWYHLRDLNNGNAITIAACPNSSPAANEMNWMERVPVDGVGERYTIRVLAIGGTTPAATLSIGFARA